MARIFSFAPIVAKDARALILGSAPSVRSLEQGFYYAHARNAFWPIMAELYGPCQSVAEKRSLILQNRLALWDSAQSCEREGSLDGAITGALPNDIEGLLRGAPKIALILFNGQAAARLMKRFFPGLWGERRCLVLPSTSPAHTLPYSQKLSAWRDALC